MHTRLIILLFKEGNANTKEAIKFFDWVFAKGDKSAVELDYVPLPESVKAQIRKDWATQVK